jgi:hypothetical protein
MLVGYGFSSTDSTMHLKKYIIFWSALLMVLNVGCGSDHADHETPVIEVRKMMDSVYLLIDYAGRTDTLGTIISRSDSLHVLDLLLNLATRDNIPVETRRFTVGTMIEQIGDRRNGEGGYWLYTVNSESIPQAASAYPVQPGDTIRFFFAAR